MRKAIVALSMASAAAISVMMPGTALAIEHELNYGTKGGTPPGAAVCTDAKEDVRVCYERGGDKWWVQDRKADGKSAIVEWANYRNGSLYRYGRCVNSHEAGSWASCNKNYYEDSTLYGYQGVWNRSAGSTTELYTTEWKFQ
ncbi:hypothetical protein LFM09_13220 [Lentzea alba]|uniref:hypothetical protein n=1 Tax=Lentzea alba TaxID=2714351 RepID=UPI0039BF3504